MDSKANHNKMRFSYNKSCLNYTNYVEHCVIGDLHLQIPQ